MVIRWILAANEGIRRIIRNALWISFDSVLRLVVGVFVSAWTARYLGPEYYGLFNYAIVFTTLFGFIAGLGIDNIVIRELVKSPEKKERLLGTASIIKLSAGISVFCLSSAGALVLKHDDPLIRVLISIISAGYIFQFFDPINLWFQARIESKNVVLAKNASFLAVSVLKVILLSCKASLILFAFASTLEIAIGGISLIIPYSRAGLSIRKWQWDGRIAKDLIRDSWPLIFSTLSILIYMKLGQVIVGDVLGNRDLGIYTAAVKISELWYFIPMSLVVSVFPKIVEIRNRDPNLYLQRLHLLFRNLAILGYLVAIPITIFSGFIIRILFGSAYSASAAILSINIWAGCFVCIGVARQQWLMAENKALASLFATIAGAVVNIAITSVLIGRVGAIGAAIAVVASQSVSAFFSSLFIDRRIFIMQLRALLLLPNSRPQP